MQIGIYFDVRNPPEWQQDPARLYAFTLEMCEEAERLGADSVWFSEHHMFADGYLPQPLTLAAAAAARTRRVRIGTAVVVAPLRPAVQIAEEAAVVDLISAGRLELGLGAGYRKPEFDLFAADLSRRYSATDARVRDIRALWDEGRVTPAPVQPRVPIWLGYTGPQGARRAGRLGEGLLSSRPELLAPYLEGLAEGGHDPAAARMGGNAAAWVTDDPERDWPTFSRHLAHQFDTYRRYGVEGTDRPVPRPVDPAKLIDSARNDALGSFTYGTPDDVAARIAARLGDAPVTTLLFWASVSGMSEDMVRRNVELVCTRVKPLLDDPDFVQRHSAAAPPTG
ncbi:MAG TPA: LLM class flavin-dependent oxidoreductase [Ilumatobacter sp.]|nr:LLM class flavin-dependent oxidoreductase [Ilumatobacter sp.]